MSSPPSTSSSAPKSGGAVPFPTSHPEGAPPPTRRQQYYQTQSSQPFSRSAAKRQSVMALGSIQHLQHQFIKQGLTSSNLSSSSKPSPLAPSTTTPLKTRFKAPHLPSLEELPPSPMKPDVDRRMPWEKEEKQILKGEKELRKEVAKGLEDVVSLWGLTSDPSLLSASSRRGSSISQSQSRRSSSTTSEADSESASIPSLPALSTLSLSPSSSLLPSTFAAIRTLQNYLITLPPPPHPKSLTDEESTTLRKGALEVLGVLKHLEEKLAKEDDATLVGSPVEMSDEDAPKATGMVSSLSSSSTIAEDDEDAVDSNDGFAYPATVERSFNPSELVEEKKVVKKWVEDVDRILFKAKSSGATSSNVEIGKEAIEKEERERDEIKRGHKRSVGVVGRKEDIKLVEEDEEEGENGTSKSSGDIEDEVNSAIREQQQQNWPEWAREAREADLGRAHLVLKANLSQDQQSRLAAPSSGAGEGASPFLDSISDGNLLSHAFNAALRSSSRPFGFIRKEEIHEMPLATTASASGGLKTEDEKEKERVGMTFRRAENLGVWLAGLKFRYNLTLSPKVDHKRIARKEPGWRDELTQAVLAWTKVVVEEWRNDRALEEAEEDDEGGKK